jgi:hypothetical protein
VGIRIETVRGRQREHGEEARFDLEQQMQDLYKRKKETEDELIFIKAQVGWKLTLGS